MSKFAKLEGQDVVIESTLAETVQEGWGDALALLASGLLGGAAYGAVGGLAGAIPGLFLGSPLVSMVGGIYGSVTGFGAGAESGIRLIVAHKSKAFNKIIENQNFKKWLKQKCDEVYKQAKKEDKSLIINFSQMEKEIEKYQNEPNDSHEGLRKERFDMLFDAVFNIGEYSLLAVGDKHTVKRVLLLLYSADDVKLVTKEIPVPSKEEIEKICNS